MDAIQGGGDSAKDKKIIDLAKKNRALQTQVESFKNKAAKATEIALKLKDDHDAAKALSQTPVASLPPEKQQELLARPVTPAAPADDKKVKELERRITKLRNETQAQGIQLDKATKLLEREIGEVVDIDALFREDSAWKGRAQKIELLKAQLKRARAAGGDDSLSVISEAPSVASGKMSHAERNLNNISSAKNREVELLRMDYQTALEEGAALKKKLVATKARNETLETQAKEVKGMFQSKIQIMLEKSENDDRLIAMLKDEVQRLSAGKGAKGVLQPGAGKMATTDEVIALRGENGRLRNQNKCFEMELAQQKEKLEKFQMELIGQAHPGSQQDADATVSELRA